MRKLIVLAFLFISIIIYSQQSVLVGQVSVHNSKYNTGAIQYVNNASIIAPFTKPASTDSEGKFQLEFVGIDPGTAIKLQAEKSGLEVVNQYDLREVIISRKSPLRIYVISKGKLAEAQTELYNISKKALFARKDALIARLRKNDKVALQELESYFGRSFENRFEAEEELINKIETLEKSLPGFALKLAQQNLDFASKMYIEAYEFYKSGQIEEVVAALDSVQLNESYLEARKNISDGKSLEVSGQELQEKGMLQITQIAESYFLKGNAFYLLFKYKKAARLFENLVELYLENEIDPLKLAGIYDELGDTYFQDGKYNNALENQLKAIKIKEKLLDPYHEELVKSYNMVALIYIRLLSYEKARSYIDKAVKIKERNLDAYDPKLANVYSDASVVYSESNGFELGLKMQQKAIDIRTRVLDSMHPELGRSYSILGGIYSDLGDYDNGLFYLSKALEIKKLTLDSKDPSLAITYNHLGTIYRNKGDYQKAISLQKKSILIVESTLDSLHPYLAGAYSNLSTTYQVAGAFEDGIKYQEKTLSIYKKLYEGNHPKIAQSFNFLSRFYRELGKLEKAFELQKKAMTIRENYFGKDHLTTSASYYMMGLIYQSLKDHSNALIFHEKALKIRMKELHAKHPTVASSYYRLAQLNQLTENYPKALEYFKKVVALDEETYKGVHPYIVQDYIALAELYIKLKNTKMVEEYRSMAYAIFEQISEGNRANLATELKQLDEKIALSKN